MNRLLRSVGRRALSSGVCHIRNVGQISPVWVYIGYKSPPAKTEWYTLCNKRARLPFFGAAEVSLTCAAAHGMAAKADASWPAKQHSQAPGTVISATLQSERNSSIQESTPLVR
eukprot:scaffold2799_cov408-Prasinococcus_capsulatus_cf.AAC.31